MNELNPNLNKANKEVTMELNFIKSGDYYIPDIKLKNPNIRLGKWGRMRREYLRQAHPIVFSEMVLSETLYEHCAEIEATAKKRMDVILPQLMKYYGVTEQLKAENQIEWVRQMNACVAQAEETIKGELITANELKKPSTDPTISYRKPSDRYFLVKSLSLLIFQNSRRKTL